MKQLIEFPLEDGTSILVETEVAEGSGMVRVSREGVPEKARQTFEAALEKIRPAAQVIIQKLRALHDAPDEITVEFGLKMSAEAGAIVAAGGLEANYKVTLKWKRKE
ncbi:MAG: CU044_2847 family protein [Anaerolineales bacterium]